MVYCKDVTEFIKRNRSEITALTKKICARYGMVNNREDIEQIFLMKLFARRILEKYNPNYPGSPKISSYLYMIITNIVKSECASNAKFLAPDIHFELLAENEEHNVVELDGIFDQMARRKLIHVDYETRPAMTPGFYNELIFEINQFKSYLLKRNRYFTLAKRKNKRITTKGLSLYVVFNLLQQGWSGREISKKHGVSSTFISSLKKEIREVMIRFGF